MLSNLVSKHVVMHAVIIHVELHAPIAMHVFTSLFPMPPMQVMVVIWAICLLLLMCIAFLLCVLRLLLLWQGVHPNPGPDSSDGDAPIPVHSPPAMLPLVSATINHPACAYSCFCALPYFDAQHCPPTKVLIHDMQVTPNSTVQQRRDQQATRAASNLARLNEGELFLY